MYFQSTLMCFVLCQAGLRNVEVEPAPQLHRAISGDLFSDEDLDEAADEAVEEWMILGGGRFK